MLLWCAHPLQPCYPSRCSALLGHLPSSSRMSHDDAVRASSQEHLQRPVNDLLTVLLEHFLRREEYDDTAMLAGWGSH